MNTTTPERTAVLDMLTNTAIQLDMLHKQAQQQAQEAAVGYVLTSEEYWALNDALNYYRSLVHFLGLKESFGDDYPAEWPQTLEQQIPLSQKILLDMTALSHEDVQHG